MPVDSTKAFTRQSWNTDIIREVNELCENSDEGCDPLPTLEEAEEDHIWTKTDVTLVQDKLVEICPENSFDTMGTPQLWSYPGIIVPIEDAIRRGWCNCTPQEEEFDFGYFPQTGFEAAKSERNASPNVVVTPSGCGGTKTTTYHSPYYPVPAGNATLNSIRKGARNAILQSQYSTAVYQVFALEDTIEELEGDIATLEGQISELEDDITSKETEIETATELRDYYCTEEPGGAQCTSYTAAVTALEEELNLLESDLHDKQNQLTTKQNELAIAQSDLAAKIIERNTFRAQYDTEAQIMWAALQSMELQWSGDIHPIRDLFPEMDEPWGDYWEDTRNKKRGRWYFILDQHNDGYKTTLVGSFSPGGYPFYIGPATERIYYVPNTCRYYDYTWHDTCLCLWEIPYQETDRCHRETRIFWKSMGFLTTDCSNVEEDDWQLNFKIKHSPNYTRSS